MHQPHQVITLHESTKKTCYLRVCIFTETKPNFMVIQCVLGKSLTQTWSLSNKQYRKQPVSGSGVRNKQANANWHMIGNTKKIDPTNNGELEANFHLNAYYLLLTGWIHPKQYSQQELHVYIKCITNETVWFSSIYSSEVLRQKSSSLLRTQFFRLLVAAHKIVCLQQNEF